MKLNEYDSELMRAFDMAIYFDNDLQSFYKISGYTFKEFENHLINLGWEKGFHIDHKIPITHFSPNTPIRLINDLRNIHPTKPIQNWIKGNRYQDNVDKDYYNEIKEYLVK